MKFSKSLIVVCALASVQAVTLFSALPRVKSTVKSVGLAPALPPRTYPMESTIEDVKLHSSLSSTGNLLRYMDRLTKYMETPIQKRTQQSFNEAEKVLNAIRKYMDKEGSRLLSSGTATEEQSLSMPVGMRIPQELFKIKQVTQQLDVSWDMTHNRPVEEWTNEVVVAIKNMLADGASGAEVQKALDMVESAVGPKYAIQNDGIAKKDAYMDFLVKKAE